MPHAGEDPTMNFSKLPKEKRNHFILVLVLTLGTLGGLGFGLIKYQYENLNHLAERKVNAQKRFKQMEDAVRNSARIDSDLAEAKQTLSQLETDVAPSGDLYSWVIGVIRTFKAPYKVEIPQYSQIGPTTDVTMLPNFPYKQASMTIAGKAHYHDLGRFLADFENRFPHIRIQNLALDVDGNPQEVELLAFRMDIVTLVKPNTL
jgi:Tfp pilus assembly protein PilO